MRENADRFEGLAETYELHRPSYPAAAFRTVVEASRADRRLALDVGAGPGNSTEVLRAAAPAAWMIMAVEPGQDMRRVLARRFAADSHVQVVDGAAEALPAADSSAGVLTACTAFHWFDRDAFFAEAARVLAPGGALALLRNRREPTPLIDALDAYIEAKSIEMEDYARRERTKEPSVRELAAVPGFMTARSQSFEWRRETDVRGLVDLYLTRSTVWSIVRRQGLRAVMADLAAIVGAHAGDGPIALEWRTSVKWAIRRSD